MLRVIITFYGKKKMQQQGKKSSCTIKQPGPHPKAAGSNVLTRMR